MVIQICLNDDPRLTFDLFTARSICVSVHLYGENNENSVSQNVLKDWMAETYIEWSK